MLGARADEKRGRKANDTSDSPLPTAPDMEVQEDLHWVPESSVEHFQTRLSEAIHNKNRELRSCYDPEGIKHLCTVVDVGWDCVDEEYCGHGLVDRCLRWIPKRLGHLEPAMKVKMEDFLCQDREQPAREIEGTEKVQIFRAEEGNTGEA